MKTEKEPNIAAIDATRILIMVVICLLAAIGALRPSSASADSQSASTLRIALVHFDPKFKDPENNLERLILLNRKAAEGGAAIILNTEMAVTGYSFQSPEDVASFAETESGRTIQAMSKLAKECGVYVGITFPERDEVTEIYLQQRLRLGPGRETGMQISQSGIGKTVDKTRQCASKRVFRYPLGTCGSSDLRR